jgi:DNA-binding NtrC family response regulator
VLGIQDSLEKQGSTQVHAEAADALRRVLIGRTIADVERHLILDTLAFCFGNRTHAARILGISIRTLRNKLNEYMEAGIAVPEPGQKPAAA